MRSRWVLLLLPILGSLPVAGQVDPCAGSLRGDAKDVGVVSSCLVVEPGDRQLEFGAQELGQEVVRSATFENRTRFGMVAQLQAPPSPFALVSSLPLRIGPRQRVRVGVRFQGIAEGPAPGTLALRSSDPIRPVVEIPLFARVERPHPSLASPLVLTSLILEEPRDGTTVPLDAPLRARGRVAGVGTGSVLAVWRVDGLDFEIAPLTLVAGREIEVETRLPLPTDSPRLHEIELRTVAVPDTGGAPVERFLATTGTIRYRVLPVAASPPELDWLSAPGAGVYLASGEPPAWTWPPLAGAVGYALFIDCAEVGRVEGSSWTLPSEVRDRLSAGEHTLEVRRLDDASAQPDPLTTPPDFEAGFTLLAKPAPLVLTATDGVVRWTGLARAGVFALEIRDPGDGRVLLRKLTVRREARLAELALPAPGHFSVSVQAFNDRGEKVAEGQPLDVAVEDRP